MLGRDLVQEWAEDEVISTTSRDADIRDIGQVRRLVTQEHPDWIGLTDAYTDVDGCERNLEQAFPVNGEGPRDVARVAQEHGAKLFYLSTDFLFDGTATHPIEPEPPSATLNVYGQSEAAGEKAIQENPRAFALCALPVFLGPSGQLPRENPTRLGDVSGIDSRG